MTVAELIVEIYSPKRKKDWDAFIDKSKNSHFMHKRDYMDYHADRFADCSLILKTCKDEILALFPANIIDGVVYSHQGLTFGGLLMSARVTMLIVTKCFDCIGSFLKSNYGVSEVIYKRTPDFYNRYPSQEDLYALFKLNAQVVRRDISSLIPLDTRISYTKGRKWSINKAKKSGIVVAEVTDIAQFWSLLISVLEERHEAKPVHTVQEMALLMERFPGNIRCFVAQAVDSSIVSGALVYETESVAHTQYLANSQFGREVGALDYLLDVLISDIYKDKKYFDFGISTENNGRTLNEGLIAQKEGFGARGFVHDFYKWDLRSFDATQ